MQSVITAEVRKATPAASVVDIGGDVTGACERELMDAYASATEGQARAVVLNFSRLDYMNSGGIGLLVTLLVRANRQGKKLLAFGLSDHYRQIFELTRLGEAIGIFGNEVEALAAAGA